MPIVIANPVSPLTPWDISGASYLSKTFAIADTLPTGVFIRADGLKMYTIGVSTTDVLEHTLSTAWDVSTATDDLSPFGVSNGNPNGIEFKPDGLQMYIVGNLPGEVRQYTLSVAWDVSTASNTGAVSTTGEDGAPRDVFFKPDGTKMYIIGLVTDAIYQYTLSTPWLVSTATYDTVSYSVGSVDNIPTGLHISPDGTKLFFCGTQNDTLHQYTMGTPWVISTATADGVSFLATGQDSDISDIFFKPDGKTFYLTGGTNDSVYQYTV